MRERADELGADPDDRAAALGHARAHRPAGRCRMSSAAPGAGGRRPPGLPRRALRDHRRRARPDSGRRGGHGLRGRRARPPRRVLTWCSWTCSMPDLGGVEATRRILADAPATRVLVLTMIDRDAALAAVTARRCARLPPQRIRPRRGAARRSRRRLRRGSAVCRPGRRPAAVAPHGRPAARAAVPRPDRPGEPDPHPPGRGPGQRRDRAASSRSVSRPCATTCRASSRSSRCPAGPRPSSRHARPRAASVSNASFRGSRPGRWTAARGLMWTCSGPTPSDTSPCGLVLSMPPRSRRSSWQRRARCESCSMTSLKNLAMSSLPAFSASRTYWP